MRRRLSRETAKRRALAKALKIDSTWWCEEWPYISLRWTLAAADCAKPRKKSSRSSVWKSPTFGRGELPGADAVGAAGEVERGGGEAIVHGHQEIAGAEDAALCAEGLFYGFAQGDTDVFDGVVLVYVEVAFGFQFEVEAAVAGDLFEHVVEEADARGDFRVALAVEV